jgi:spermidine synthase
VQVWFTEDQAPGLRISCQVDRVLHEERTPFQHLAVLETRAFGRMLVLDNIIQTTEKDEFVYHEMIAHVPLCSHPSPRRVLIIGGGDGGTMREVLRHPVEEVHLVEIDQRVVEAARNFLPTLSAGMDDPRGRVIIVDGLQHVKEYKDYYDLVIVDSTDPIGPAVGLFSVDFYRDVHNALRADGMVVAQTESPFFNAELVPKIVARIRANFPLTRLYLGVVPTYPGGMWTFTAGSKRHDPAEPVRGVTGELRYYSSAVHRASFVLPPYVHELLEPPQATPVAGP